MKLETVNDAFEIVHKAKHMGITTPKMQMLKRREDRLDEAICLAETEWGYGENANDCPLVLQLTEEVEDLYYEAAEEIVNQ